MKIQILQNTAAEFYKILGPYLANRAVIKEIGYPIYDDPDKRWVIASHYGKITGFCYLWPKAKGTKIDIGSFYATSDAAIAELFDVLAKELDVTATITTRHDGIIREAKRIGFAEEKSNGFTTLIRTV